MSVITISSPERAAELYGWGWTLHDYVARSRSESREECTGRFIRAMAHWYEGDEKAAAAWCRAALMLAPRCA